MASRRDRSRSVSNAESSAPKRTPPATLYVYVDRSETVWDKSRGPSATDSPELVMELRSRIAYLERQVEEEREPRRRADTIIARLTQANASLAARVPELEAPAESASAATSDVGAADEQSRG